jgi:hypothetical protein
VIESGQCPHQSLPGNTKAYKIPGCAMTVKFYFIVREENAGRTRGLSVHPTITPAVEGHRKIKNSRLRNKNPIGTWLEPHTQKRGVIDYRYRLMNPVITSTELGKAVV